MISKAALLLLAFTIAVVAPPTVEPKPNLCDIDAGRWCTDCGGPLGPPCPPSEDKGWMCCWPGTNFCVSTTVDDCEGGVLGWCDNFTEDADGATCWD